MVNYRQLTRWMMVLMRQHTDCSLLGADSQGKCHAYSSPLWHLLPHYSSFHKSINSTGPQSPFHRITLLADIFVKLDQAMKNISDAWKGSRLEPRCTHLLIYFSNTVPRATFAFAPARCSQGADIFAFNIDAVRSSGIYTKLYGIYTKV
jgi:hypothetical protein